MSDQVICPECETKATFSAVGPYRATCDECGALVKNHEIGWPEHNDPDGEYVRMEKRP